MEWSSNETANKLNTELIPYLKAIMTNDDNAKDEIINKVTGGNDATKSEVLSAFAKLDKYTPAQAAEKYKQLTSALPSKKAFTSVMGTAGEYKNMPGKQADPSPEKEHWINTIFKHFNEYRNAYITGAIIAIVAATGYLIWRHMKKKTLNKVMNDPKLTDIQKIKYIQDSIRDGKARLAKAKNDKDKKAAEDSIKEHEEALKKLQGGNTTKQESFDFLLNY